MIKQVEGLPVSFLGPDLDEGPLPAIFYFSLSDTDSLGLDPYNQFPLFLTSYRCRIFSMMIPGHEIGRLPEEAIAYWAQMTSQGHPIITAFIEQAVYVISALSEKGVLSEGTIATTGLSRGGFLAAHIAARQPLVNYVLGFAPLTELKKSSEFHSLTHHPLVEELSFEHVLPSLAKKTIRFYIGNRDVRVGTERCFNLVRQLVDKAYDDRIRSAPIEMIVYPSIGYQGHGTPKHIFEQGALWIKEKLSISS